LKRVLAVTASSVVVLGGTGVAMAAGSARHQRLTAAFA
jgi:hypothetical protein